MGVTLDYCQAFHEKYPLKCLHYNYENSAVQLNLKNLSLSNRATTFHHGALV